MNNRPSKVLRRRLLIIVWLCIAWNVLETSVGVGAGIIAHSISLTGFGLDSLIELFSAGVVLWRFFPPAPRTHHGEPGREATSLRLIAASFFVLAIYVGGQSVADLVHHTHPADSPVGIALAIASLFISTTLGLAELRIGRAMHNPTVRADSVETLVCGCLAGILLLGLGCHELLNWSWADPVGGLLMVPFLIWQAYRVWKEAPARI